ASWLPAVVAAHSRLAAAPTGVLAGRPPAMATPPAMAQVPPAVTRAVREASGAGTAGAPGGELSRYPAKAAQLAAAISAANSTFPR
ncbi:MAG TPA: hypothetical protein VHB47_24820, partial [Thermoanaerobaculia bacterium]|nr:hypothetical protein [Thermoanaerobaculia bacterium]